MTTTADILPHPAGIGWLVAWQTERMTEPALWLYATQAEAEQVAATFRGENATPLPAPHEEVRREAAPPSARTAAALYTAAQEAGLVETLFPVEPVGDSWDVVELDRMVAEEKAEQDATRADRLAALVEPGYAGRLCRMPHENSKTYRKRVRAARRPHPSDPGDQAGPREQYSAAFFREVNRLHVSGVLTRAETRRLLGLESGADTAATPWWRLGRTA